MEAYLFRGVALCIEVVQTVALESAAHEFDMRAVDPGPVLAGIEVEETVNRGLL
jgi:hypothetical protein